MTPDQLREAGRTLWGHRIWHVKLASKIPGIRPHHVAAMEAGEIAIPQDVREMLIDSLRKRTMSCIAQLQDLGVGL